MKKIFSRFSALFHHPSPSSPPPVQDSKKEHGGITVNKGVMKFIVVAFLINFTLLVTYITVSAMLDKVATNFSSATLLFYILTACSRIYDIFKAVNEVNAASFSFYHIIKFFASF